MPIVGHYHSRLIGRMKVADTVQYGYMQPCQIYYNLYNILYGTERHTISIKVEKIYYIMSYSDLYYKSI